MGTRRALKVDPLEEPVHLPCGHALAAFGGDGFDLAMTRPTLVPSLAERKMHGRVAEVFEHVAQLPLEDVAVRRGLAVGAAGGHRVPLVDDDDDAAAALVGVAADGGVAGGNAFGGVEDQQRDVGGFEVPAGHDDGELFRHEVGFAFAADAGGVDEAEARAL